MVKSPLDTTIYTPALRKVAEQDIVINQISDFVENIRMESQCNSLASDHQRPSSRVRSEVVRVERGESSSADHHARREREDEQESKEAADKILLDAEQFKASLVAPQKGMLPDNIDGNIELLHKLDNDDDFFHVSCHIDPTLRVKIEHGEFIDLEKLLPKPRSISGGTGFMNDTGRLELMIKDGHPYLGPPQSEHRINGVRKWDQAFRVYATIYTQANPSRAGEIWQYVDIIHTAANTYQWDNVACYDYTFRQLMAAKPWRSWAKTYTQSWNIALKDPLVKGSSGGPGNSSVNRQSGGLKQFSRDWKENCCWRYNKNKCNKSSNDCEWDHHCTSLFY